MYATVENFLELLGSDQDEIISFSQEDTRTAIAVLYYQVILVDGQIRHEELDQFRTILAESLDVSEDELMLFEDTVLKHIENEKSLFPFTTIVKKLPLEKRLEIIKHMKQISVSDHELHEFEINLVGRTAELLEVDLNSHTNKRPS